MSRDTIAPSRTQLMTIDEVAALLRVSERQVYDLTKHHGLEAVNVGTGTKTLWRWHPDDVDRFIRERTGAARLKVARGGRR